MAAQEHRGVDAGDAWATALGWDDGWEVAWGAAWHGVRGTADRHPARVLAAHRDAWLVATAGGDGPAVLAGRFRHEARGPADLPAVGDWVAVTGAAAGPGAAVIQSVLPRRSAFRRSVADEDRAATLADEQVLAANVDLAVVVMGLDGDFNPRRLERYLAVAWSGGARPLVLLNKADLPGDHAARISAAEAVAPGVAVRPVSARTGAGLQALQAELPPGRTAVILGSSGAGKSTLVNGLLGHDRQRTSAVRQDDARGRHTTTHRELVRLPGGALLIDTPGLRALAVAGAADGLAPAFADIGELASACRFRDCRHDREPGCAVRRAVQDGRLAAERLAGHRRLEREAAHRARAADPLLRAEERRRWKTIHASVQEHLRHKHGGAR